MDDTRTKALMQQVSIPCFIEHPADLFYLTGLPLSKGRLLATPTHCSLFVDGRYYEQARKKAPCPVFLWGEQTKLTHPQIGFDSATVTFEEYLALKKSMPHVEWLPIPAPVRRLRLIKDAAEIAALKQAAQLTLLGIEHVHHCLKEGVTEQELAFEFETFCRKKGASGLSFETIIAFGDNGAYPHYHAGTRRLCSGDSVLVDAGAIVNHYHGDMTRVFYFGPPDPRIVKLEKIVRTAQHKAIQSVRPGIKLGQLDQIVRDEFDAFNVKPLYMHSLGHGIGLETHEFPRIHFENDDKDLLLEAGMVFTIEPGLYQAGVGGVRIEDMVLVTETGHVKI